MVVSLQRGSPALRYKTVDLDYETSGRTVKPGAELRPVLPRIGMPCLSFCWELVTPPCWQARLYGPGLLPSDPGLVLDLALWFTGGSGTAGPAGNQARARTPTNTSPARRNPGRHAVRRQSTFAEWFTRWDSGTTPLIIDRLALSAAGHGPRSRCTPNRVGPRGQLLSMRTLQQYGLTLLRLDSGLGRSHPEGEAARSDQADNWLRAIGEALLWGSDRSDRFQTVARRRRRDHSQGRSRGRLGRAPACASRLVNLAIHRRELAGRGKSRRAAR